MNAQRLLLHFLQRRRAQRMQMHHPEHDWLQRKKHKSACQIWYHHLWSADKKRKEISGGPNHEKRFAPSLSEESTFDALKKLLWSNVVSIQFDRVHVAGQAIGGTRGLSSAPEMKSEKRWEFAEAFSRSPEAVFFPTTSWAVHSNTGMQWRSDRKGILTAHWNAFGHYGKLHAVNVWRAIRSNMTPLEDIWLRLYITPAQWWKGRDEELHYDCEVSKNHSEPQTAFYYSVLWLFEKTGTRSEAARLHSGVEQGLHRSLPKYDQSL